METRDPRGENAPAHRAPAPSIPDRFRKSLLLVENGRVEDLAACLTSGASCALLTESESGEVRVIVKMPGVRHGDGSALQNRAVTLLYDHSGLHEDMIGGVKFVEEGPEGEAVYTWTP